MRIAPTPRSRVFGTSVFGTSVLAAALLTSLSVANAGELPLPRARLDAGAAVTAEAIAAAAARVGQPNGEGSATSAFAPAAAAAAKPNIFQRIAAANRRAKEERLLQEASAPGALKQLMTVPGPDGTPVALSRTSCGDAASFVAAFTKMDEVDGRGQCGIENPIAVSALTVNAVAVTPTATLNCAVTKAVADWMREAVIGAAEAELGAKPARIVNASSYACRSRGHKGRRLSEHAYGNALDIGAFVLEDGRRIDVAHQPKGSAEARFLASIRESACRYFTTVLGPGYDKAHADHFHLDVARHTSDGDYRFCR